MSSTELLIRSETRHKSHKSAEISHFGGMVDAGSTPAASTITRSARSGVGAVVRRHAPPFGLASALDSLARRSTKCEGGPPPPQCLPARGEGGLPRPVQQPNRRIQRGSFQRHQVAFRASSRHPPPPAHAGTGGSPEPGRAGHTGQDTARLASSRAARAAARRDGSSDASEAAVPKYISSGVSPRMALIRLGGRMA